MDQIPPNFPSMEQLPTQTMMGSTKVVPLETTVEKRPDMARYTEIPMEYLTVREQREPQYIQGTSTEEQGHALVTTVREETYVAGQTQQQVVEIPTEEVQVSYVDIPEVQVV